jgi:hypothetical protein
MGAAMDGAMSAWMRSLAAAVVASVDKVADMA